MAQSVQSSGGLMLKVGMDLNHSSMQNEFYKVMNKLQKDATIDMAIKVDNDEFTRAVEHFEDEMGNIIEVTNIFSRSWGNVQREITNIQTPLDRLNAATKSQKTNTDKLSLSQQNLNTHIKQSVNLFQDFTNTFLKMAKFNTINLIYDGLINKMSEAIEITNNFDKAMTEFKKVTDTSNLSLSAYTETLGQLGEVTGRSATQMLEAATEFSKGGFTADESAKLAQVATLYQNIADAEISAGDAASFIISQMKAFDIEADKATTILDKVNEVSNNYSVSSTDIASALTKQSASLAAYGNDLNESIALVTAGTEIMTGQAGKVARGLRTIGANITQLAQGAKTFEIQVNGVTQSVNLWNEAGTDMLDTYQVLQQISGYWEDMTNAERSSLAITLAKKTQMDTFLAVMGNFEDAEKSYVTALLSEGSALKENSAYMESIEAHQAQLKAQWEQLVLSAPFEDLEKILLKLGTTILKFANSDIGQLTIKITAIVAVLGGMTILLAKIPPMIVAWSISVMGLNEALTTTELVFGALNTTMLASPLFWGTVAVAAIVGIVAVVKKLTHALEEQREVLEDANDDYDEAQSEIETLKGKLSVLDEELAKLYKQKIQLTDQEDLNRLSQQTKELKEQERSYKIQLQLAEAKAQAAEREAIAAAKKIKNTQTTANIQGTNVHTNKEETIFTATGTQQEVFGQAVKEMAQLDIQIKQNEQTIAALTEKYGEHSTQVGAVIAKNEELQQKLWDLQDGSIEYADSLNEVVTRLGDFNVTIDGQTYSVQHLLDVYTQMTGTGEDVANTNNDIADSTEDSEESAEDATDAWSDFLDSLEDIQSAYETLDKAAKEYNENGSITAATLKKLNKLEPQYLEALQLEGNQYQVNVDLLKTLYETEKAEAIAKLELAKNTSLINLANEYLSESTQAVDTDIGNCAQEATDAAPNYDELAQHAGEAAIKLREVHDYLVGGEGDDSARWEEFKQKWQETTDFYDKQIENVKASDIGLVDSAKSAAGGHKDAWVEAFEEEQRQLKHALEMNEITEIEYYQKLKDLNEKYFGEISGNHQKYIKEYQENEEEIYKGMKAIYDKVADYLREAIEQGYEDAINALKKEEKKVLAEIKAQIEALKDEKKKVLDDIQKQIDGLKKKKDKVQDYWNSQIDKIKESNNELQKQNELLEKQQALQRAKAQKVMVMKDGKFQLGENESAVAQAEQSLAQYQDQMSYEQQIDEMEKLRDKQVETIDDRIEKLEEYKDYMEDYYDEQIDALEKYYDQVEQQYEEQIEALQEQLDAFKKHAEEQKKIEEARLAAQLLGIEKESDLFEISLANLENYVAKYNALVASLEVPSVFGDGLNLPVGGSAPSGGGGGKGATITKFASGTANVRSNEIALVGESPNAELVVGSHLNRSMGGGTLLNLSKGSGVVNAESTATLAGLLNGVVTPTNVSNSRSTMQTFTFGNLTLPNVTDAESFVNTLSHKFNNYAIQYGNSRK